MRKYALSIDIQADTGYDIGEATHFIMQAIGQGQTADIFEAPAFSVNWRLAQMKVTQPQGELA
jgi:hypothetical protein